MPDLPPTLTGKKLGILLSCPPRHPNFQHALNLAETALNQGLQVYLYCIDEAVLGLSNPHLQSLSPGRLKLFACGLAARKHAVPLDESATFSGLATLSDIITATDRFLSFNA